MCRNWIDTTDVAKIIRGELKKHFPETTFQVHSKRYSGGSSIDVRWLDGPTVKAVESRIGMFHGAEFDGMIDLKSYIDQEWNGEKVHFGNDYLFCSRNYSDANLEAAVNWYKNTYGDPESIEFIPAHFEGVYHYSAYFSGTYEVERRVREHLQNSTL